MLPIRPFEWYHSDIYPLRNQEPLPSDNQEIAYYPTDYHRYGISWLASCLTVTGHRTVYTHTSAYICMFTVYLRDRVKNRSVAPQHYLSASEPKRQYTIDYRTLQGKHPPKKGKWDTPQSLVKICSSCTIPLQRAPQPLRNPSSTHNIIAMERRRIFYGAA